MDKEWRTKGKLRLYPHRLSTHFPSCGEIHTYHFPFHTYPHHLSIVYILQFLLNISTIYRLFHFSHIIYYYYYLFSFLYKEINIYINKKKKTPSLPPVRGRPDTETSLEEERKEERKKRTQGRMKGRKKGTQE